MKHLASTILFTSILGTAALAHAEASTNSTLVPVAPVAGDDAPVVGGTTVPPGAWPDVVAVLARDAMCSGTLIAPDVVLTAGHCIDTDPVEVVVGSVDLAKPDGTAIRVKKAIAYPDWEHTYDVGVLVLEDDAPAAPRAIARACTAKEHLVSGAKVRVVGFGLTRKDGTGDNTRLHQALLPVDDASCTQDPACETAVAPDGEFTAGGGGVDACFGDSGGPIYVTTTHGPALIGVVSRGGTEVGEPCGGGGVYVRADAVVPWIEKVTGKKLTRSHCDAPADGPADGEIPGEAGGCSAGRNAVGGGALLGLLVLALLAAPRRTPMSFD
jgi:secreted trypsin-like serine protease